MNFPSNEELNSRITNSTQYLKFKDVPQNIWYKITSIHEIDTKNGPAQILTLTDRDNNTLQTFSTSIIQNELNGNPYHFIRSTGKQPNKRYYGFDLSQ